MEEGWEEAFLTAQEYKANMARDILENAGIKAVIMNQHDSAYQSFGDFIVFVPKEDLNQAIQLLKALKH